MTFLSTKKNAENSNNSISNNQTSSTEPKSVATEENDDLPF